MKIAVIGTGYVGLVAGACFADFGNEVTCVDIDARKVDRLSRGELPIFEPGLDGLVTRSLAEGRLRFTTNIPLAVAGVEAVFIAVGTPSAPDGSGAADLSHVLAAAESIGRALTGWAVIVTKSTVPVGTAEQVRKTVARTACVPFAVASNPEFLKEGDAINDFLKPDRVIIGTDDARARELLRRLYAPFVRTNDHVLFMDIRSAELTKYAANAMLATRVSFMNDMADLCERVGADIEAVRRGVGTDSRIGPKFLFAGIGYGGSCFPKDVRAVLATARATGTSLAILDAVERINERQKGVLVDKLAAHFGGSGRLRGRTVALWGLSFKPGTDDLREAPSLVVIDRLLAAGATVRAFDPVAGDAIRARYAVADTAAATQSAAAGGVGADRLVVCDSNYAAAEGAHALCLLTEWREFRRPDFHRLKALMAEPTIFDGRNIWDAAELRGLGFTYYGIGRP